MYVPVVRLMPRRNHVSHFEQIDGVEYIFVFPRIYIAVKIQLGHSKAVSLELSNFR